jgi:hypothetical protein
MDGSVLFIDQSGSMTSSTADNSTVSAYEISHVFAAALMKRNSVDVVCFGTRATMVSYSPSSSIMDLVKRLNEEFQKHGGGTSISCAFDLIKGINTRYKRIFILSDMQIWIQENGETNYRSMGYQPYVYAMNVSAHGAAQFSPNNRKVVMVAGWSSQVFDLMKNNEIDPKVLIHTIESLDFKKYLHR